MDAIKTRYFLWHWMRIAFCDAWVQTFGLLFVIGTLGLAYGLPKPIINPFWNSVACVSVSFLLALIVFIIPASIKAYRLLRPLIITVTDSIRSPDLDFNENFRGYNVTVIVRNRSAAYIKDCVAYAMNVPRGNYTISQRFIEKFDLPPNCQKNVSVAYWFARELPNVDDKDIGIPGPESGCFGGNICMLPGPEAVLNVKIYAQNIDTKDIRCHVWIDNTSRSLRGQQLFN